MYLKMAEEEDKKTAERWQKDAEGILFFVSFTFRTTSHFNSKVIEWFVLCRSRRFGFRDHLGPQAKLSGYIRFLS
jgi:hypothetical protein